MEEPGQGNHCISDSTSMAGKPLLQVAKGVMLNM
jgi:hypothetical protein